MGERTADTAAVKVGDPSLLAAWEDYPLIEGVVTLGIDDTGAPQQVEGMALGEEVAPQASAWGITDLQFPDQGGVAQSALFQIPPCLRVAIELPLIERGSLPQ